MPHLRSWLPLAVYILVPSLFILPILFSGKMLYGADVVSVFHYSRIVIADAFRSGRLPVWDPHVMAGFPLLAGVQGAIFYPPTWLCVLMSAGTFWTLSAWSHLILAGVFAHRWLERGLGLEVRSALAGSVVFMMSGYMAGHVYAGHVNYVWAYPWIPAVFWRLERFIAGPTLKRGVLLSLVLALLCLAGVPQYVFFAGLLIAARLFHFVFLPREGRRARSLQAAQVLAWLGLGLAFCATQLLPTLELVGQMQRGSGIDTPFFASQFLEPERLIDLLFASGVARRDDTLWWETCGYLGGGVFLLLMAAFTGKHRQRHLWIGIGVASLLLALGQTLPLYDAFVYVVPGAAWFRGPGRYLLIFTVAGTALAGMGFDALWRRGPLGFRYLAAGLAVVAAVQLGMFGRPCFKATSEDRLRFIPQVQARLKERLGLEGRLALEPGSILEMGCFHAAGLDQVGGYEPMMLRRYAECVNVAQGSPAETTMAIVAGVGKHRIIQMLAARLSGELRHLEEYPDFLPRAWVVNNAVVLESREERLAVLTRGPFDPGKTVILESYPTEAPPVTTEKSAGRAKVMARKPGYYEIEAENDADAYLVLSEAYYPGWTAEVDGKPVDVLPANHLIQTIRLPAGKHIVRFEYRSRFLGLGFVVAALAALLPVGLLVRRHRQQFALQRLPGAP